MLLVGFEPGIPVPSYIFRMVENNKDLKRKLIELDRILEDKIRERDAKVEAVKLKMYDLKPVSANPGKSKSRDRHRARFPEIALGDVLQDSPIRIKT